jgi:hypothetical protein
MRQRYQISYRKCRSAAPTFSYHPWSLLCRYWRGRSFRCSRTAMRPWLPSDSAKPGLTNKGSQWVTAAGNAGSHPELPCCQRANMLFPPPSFASHFGRDRSECSKPDRRWPPPFTDTFFTLARYSCIVMEADDLLRRIPLIAA